MFPRCFWLFIAALSAIALSTPSLGAQAEERDEWVIGERHVITSQILGSDRDLWIALPPSYASSHGYRDYPVLYALDGNLFFHPFTGVVRQLSMDATPLVPEMIIVGVSSQNRLTDSTPTRSLIGADGREASAWGASGGGEDFQRFLEDEVIAYVEANFSTSDYRILAGYSLTGLSVAHNLFTRPDMFDAHIIMDASIWWDNYMILDLADAAREAGGYDHNQVFITTTSQNYPAPYITVEAGGRELVAALEADPIAGLALTHHALTRETHHSLAMISLYEGLVSVFDGYMLTLDDLYLHPENIAGQMDALSARLDAPMAPSEGVMGFFGQYFLYGLSEPEPEKALTYFRLNTRYYPQSPHSWFALGQALADESRLEEAREALQQTLELDPGHEAAQALLDALE